MKAKITGFHLSLFFLSFSLFTCDSHAVKIQCHYSHFNKNKHPELTSKIEIEINVKKADEKLEIVELLPGNKENVEKVLVDRTLKLEANKRCREEIRNVKGDNYFLDSPKICLNGEEISIVTKEEYLKKTANVAKDKIAEELPVSSVMEKIVCLGGKTSVEASEASGDSVDFGQRELGKAVMEAYRNDRLLVHTTEGEGTLLSLYQKPGSADPKKGKEPFSTTLIPSGTSMNFWKNNGILYDIKDTIKIYESSLTDAQTSERYYNPDRHPEQRSFKTAKEYYDSLKGRNYREVVSGFRNTYHDKGASEKMFKYNEVWATHPDQSAIGLFLSNTGELHFQGNLSEVAPPTQDGKNPERDYFNIWRAQQHILKNTCQTLPIFAYDAFKKTLTPWLPSAEEIARFKNMQREEIVQEDLYNKLTNGEYTSWEETKKALAALSDAKKSQFKNFSNVLIGIIELLPKEKLGVFKDEFEGIVGTTNPKLWEGIKVNMIKKGNTGGLQKLRDIKSGVTISDADLRLGQLHGLDGDHLAKEILKNFKIQQLSSSEAGKLITNIEGYLSKVEKPSEKASPFYKAADSLKNYFDTQVSADTFKDSPSGRDHGMDTTMEFLKMNLNSR